MDDDVLEVKLKETSNFPAGIVQASCVLLFGTVTTSAQLNSCM